MSIILAETISETLEQTTADTAHKKRRGVRHHTAETREKLSLYNTVYAAEHPEKMAEKGRKSRGVKRNFSPELRERYRKTLAELGLKGLASLNAKIAADPELSRKRREGFAKGRETMRKRREAERAAKEAIAKQTVIEEDIGSVKSVEEKIVDVEESVSTDKSRVEVEVKEK